MEVRANGSERNSQRQRYLLITALLLMIEDQHRTFDVAERREMPVDRLLKFCIGKLLLGVPIRVGKAVLPIGGLVRDRDQRTIFAGSPLPFVLRHIHRDAVEIGGKKSLLPETGKSTVQAKKDILREIFKVLAASGKAKKCAEDHRLVVAHNLLEGVVDVQAGSDCKATAKFHLRH